MKILITGANGQLGYELQNAFSEHELYLGDTHNYDITDLDLIIKETKGFQPELIIHGAAWTNVDGAEANKDLCKAINVDGSRNVATAAKSVDVPIVAISTDYVFPGDAAEPYKESDQPNPLSFYGQTKLDGEKAVQEVTDKFYICRTAWLYGGPKPTPETDFSIAQLPKNFVNTMLRVGKGKPEMGVVGDQLGGPTYAKDLSLKIKELIGTENYGIYHITNTGVTSWAGFSREIFSKANYSTVVKDLTSEEWESINPTSTKRPKYSVLGHENLAKAGLSETRSWQAALADYLSHY